MRFADGVRYALRHSGTATLDGASFPKRESPVLSTPGANSVFLKLLGFNQLQENC
jgi:hypothetical protein